VNHDTSEVIAQLRRQLAQMDTWIDKAQAHATAKKYDANLLLQMRLAPDMFPLVRQYASACDSAKFAAARAAGVQPPSHPDDQVTWDQVRARVRDVVNYLEGFDASKFTNTASAEVRNPRYPGKYIPAADYLFHHSIPNFHFHCAMAYAILRHNGVDLGKADFLGTVPWRDEPK
jgi:hypothetical protein